MKRTLLSLLALASLSLASAQTSVLPYTPGIHQEGITYYLPKTALSITLTATRVTSTSMQPAISVCPMSPHRRRLRGPSTASK